MDSDLNELTDLELMNQYFDVSEPEKQDKNRDFLKYILEEMNRRKKERESKDE